jgi:hypothetical protein
MTPAGPAAIVNNKPILSTERSYMKTMTAGVQLKKKSGHDSQGAWRQDELIGCKPPVVN